MAEQEILDLKSMVQGGRLFRSPADANRVEAFLTPTGIENHAANMIELPNGDLLCAWFSGTQEGIPDVGIALSRLPAGGARWTEPVWVAEDPSRSEQNPVLFLTPEGKVWLLWTAQETRGCTKDEWKALVAAGEATGDYGMQWTSIVRRRVSDDYGHSWGPIELFLDKPSSFIRHPLVVMSNDEWLLPMYYSLESNLHADDYSVMLISSDQGASWDEHVVPQSRGRVQASVLELEPGKLIAFFRSRAADWIYVSHSADYGRTWKPPEPTSLPNNNASTQNIKLASGHLAMVFNNYQVKDEPHEAVWPRRRYPVTIAISEDGGKSWPFMRDVDAGDAFWGDENVHLNRRLGYPGLIQTRDGMIHVFYSYRGRQCIKYVRLGEEWVRGQLDYVVEG